MPDALTTRDMTVGEFCDKHNACRKGREWALKNKLTLQQVWQTAKPDWFLWVATRPCVLDDRTLRLFACWSVRQVWHHLTDDRGKNAVEVAERFANGKATKEELAAAAAAAWAAVNAVWATLPAARVAQVRWLRKNAVPCFLDLKNDHAGQPA